MIELADASISDIVFAPGLVIVASRSTESRKNGFQIVFILQTDVLVHEGDTSRSPVIGVSRQGSASHHNLQHYAEVNADSASILALEDEARAAERAYGFAWGVSSRS